MYNVKDNAEWQLLYAITSSSLSLTLVEGDGDKFPDAPFLAVLNKRDSNGDVTSFETIEVTAKTGMY